MVYTFQISDVSAQSHSLINLLISLSKDYEFLTVLEAGASELSTEQEHELDRRYENFLQNPRNGNTWTKVKQSLL